MRAPRQSRAKLSFGLVDVIELYVACTAREIGNSAFDHHRVQ